MEEHDAEDAGRLIDLSACARSFGSSTVGLSATRNGTSPEENGRAEDPIATDMLKARPGRTSLQTAWSQAGHMRALERVRKAMRRHALNVRNSRRIV
jgi:hypothetical protein